MNATHYLIIILVMLRFFGKSCRIVALSAMFLTIAGYSVEAATLLRNIKPKSSALDDRLITSSYYDLAWVNIPSNFDYLRTTSIASLVAQYNLEESLRDKSTLPINQEFADSIQKKSTQQVSQELLESIEAKTLSAKQADGSKALNLAESQKLMKSISNSGLQEKGANNRIQGNSESQNTDKELEADKENTMSLAQANKIVSSVSGEEKVSAVKARQILTNDGKKISKDNREDLFSSDIGDRLNDKLDSIAHSLPFMLSSFIVFIAGYMAIMIFFDRTIVLEDGTIAGGFFGGSSKLKIAEETILLHNRLMQEVQKLAPRIVHLDDAKFSEAEFLLFLRWENNISKGKGEYKDLKEPIKLLQVGLDTKNSFIALEQTEFRYRGSGQQEFYRYITEILTIGLTGEQFRERVDNKLAEILPILMTEEGKQALMSYSQALYKLAENDLALKLMLLFRQSEFQNYSVLKSISDIIEKAGGKNLLDANAISASVMLHEDDFDKVGKIIGLSPQQCTIESYTKILQYLGLSYRHAKDYYEFQELIDFIKQWLKKADYLNRIRQQYNAKEYELPKEFLQPIPGEKEANKYYEFI